MAANARYLIELVLRTKKEGTGGKELDKELSGVQTKAQTAGSALTKLGSVLSAGAAAMGVAVGAAVALKKALDLGREGAVVTQTAESFDLLMTKVGASSDTLDKLRDASRGTISDMDLMSSTTTLLAGAQGELATQLAGATPELLEIAKAANKLNPSLGDTTFLYNSLATGIKRASPLILDNLGLTIKIGEANEKYAESIGKTVEELTAEEEKMALLQATLEAGNVLVEQAGGSAESATDSFDQFTASMENLTNQLKAAAAPALGEVAQGLSDVLDFLDPKDVQAYAREIANSSESYREYANAMLDAIVADKQLTEADVAAMRAAIERGAAIEDVAKDQGRLKQATVEYARTLGLMTETEWAALTSAKALEDQYGVSEVRFLAAQRALEAFDEEVARARDEAKHARLSTEIWTDEIKELSDELGMAERDVFQYKVVLGYTDEELKAVADDLDLTGGELAALSRETGLSRAELEQLNSEFEMGEDAIKSYAEATQAARDAFEGFTGTLASGIVDLRELGKASTQSAEEYEQALAELDAKAKAVYSSVKLEYEDSLPDPTTAAERLNMTADAWDEWGLRLNDIIQNGVASPWFDVLQQMGMEKPPDTGVREWAEGLKSEFYEGELPQLINTASASWQEHSASVKQSQAEATAAYQQEVNNRIAAVEEERAALTAAREAQLAAEQEARNRATAELALSLAEQTGMLQAWSEQKFGPDFSQVADTADEVLALIDSGMLEIDGSLQTLIGNTASGIQNALDITGTAAEKNKDILNTIVTPGWADEQQERIKRGLDLAAALPPEDARAVMRNFSSAIDKGVPTKPFANITTDWKDTEDSIIGGSATLTESVTGNFATILDSFQGVEESIIGNSAEMMSAVIGDFEAIRDEGSTPVAEAILNEWVRNSVFPDMIDWGARAQKAIVDNFGIIGDKSETMEGTVTESIGKMEEATDDLVDSLGDLKRGFDNATSAAGNLATEIAGLITKFNELNAASAGWQGIGPTLAGITGDARGLIGGTNALLQTAGGDLGYQMGGQVAIRGTGGIDSVPVRFMATPGETVTVTPATEPPPPVAGGQTVNVTVSSAIYNQMDAAEFEARVLGVVNQALRMQ